MRPAARRRPALRRLATALVALGWFVLSGLAALGHGVVDAEGSCVACQAEGASLHAPEAHGHDHGLADGACDLESGRPDGEPRPAHDGRCALCRVASLAPIAAPLPPPLPALAVALSRSIALVVLSVPAPVVSIGLARGPPSPARR